MAAANVEALDFEPEEDDLMDEEGVASDNDTSPSAPLHKIKSAITGGLRKTKGRGFREDAEDARASRLAGPDFDSLHSEGGPAAQRSIEGWIALITGIHEEAGEDDIQNVFGEFGEIKNLHLNLDRRTGFVKGYALIEYEKFEEAEAAIQSMNGGELLTQAISVGWAFRRGGAKRRSPMRRSRSPRRRN